ncbi:hypothetical protein HMPREF1585_00963 [Gardnerella vaginalis JCP8481B]|nr:hypothetical protein HMPREF1585_00963 [Gardnerella vaginalis JCP8481B]
MLTNLQTYELTNLRTYKLTKCATRFQSTQSAHEKKNKKQIKSRSAN